MRQILQKYSEYYFVEMIAKSSDKNPLRLTARHFPSICTGDSDRRSAAKKSVVCSKNDRRRESYCYNTCDVVHVCTSVLKYFVQNYVIKQFYKALL